MSHVAIPNSFPISIPDNSIATPVCSKTTAVSMAFKPIFYILGTGVLSLPALAASAASEENLSSCLRDIVPSVTSDGDARTWADRAGNRTAPLAVVYPGDVEEVAGVLSCVESLNLSSYAVSGRHFYQSIGDVVSSPEEDLVLIDVRGLCRDEDIVVDVEQGTVTVPAGCPNGRLLAALPPGYVFPVGNCPTVGLGGFVLGGGMSDASRYAGLACDALVSLSMVKSDSTRVESTSDPEVLYAACGGGVGPDAQIEGVVTSFTLRMTPSLTDTYSRITVLVGAEGTPDALVALQDMLGRDDNRYFGVGGGGVIGVLREFDVGLVLNLLYFGGGDEGLALLREAGVLDDAWSSAAVDEYGSFQDAMAISMVQEGIGMDMEVACELFGCDEFTGLVVPSAAPAIVAMLSDLGSPLLDKHSTLWQSRQFSYPVPGFMLRGLDREAWARVTEVAMTPAVDAEGKVLCSRYYMLLAHFAGGEVGARDVSASAYPWRDDTMLVTWLNGMDPTEAAACEVESARYEAAFVAGSVALDRAYVNYRGSDAYDSRLYGTSVLDRPRGPSETL